MMVDEHDKIDETVLDDVGVPFSACTNEER